MTRQPHRRVGRFISVLANYFAVTEVNIVKESGSAKSDRSKNVGYEFLPGVSCSEVDRDSVCFHLSHVGSVSFITHPIRKRERENSQFRIRVEELIKRIVKQVTCPFFYIVNTAKQVTI